jgi:hypothetical protein
MSNPDERVEAANRLGAEVTFDHPVPPRRDRFGAPRCPVCNSALKDPIYSNGRDLAPPLPGMVITSAVFFEGACANCKQILNWTGWQRYLSLDEQSEHARGGCHHPNYCARCRETMRGER